MKHLVDRAKKKQLADDRLSLIAFENRKLMEKMSVIMSGVGPGVGGVSMNTSTMVSKNKGNKRSKPLQKGEAIYNLTGLNTVLRKTESLRIASENKQILQRIRNGNNTRSFYDHTVMGQEEKRRLAYKKNISKAHQRDVRVKKWELRKKSRVSNASSATSVIGTGGFDTADDNTGYSQILSPQHANTLSLHTARQIQNDIATKRGMPLPDIISQRPADRYGNANNNSSKNSNNTNNTNNNTTRKKKNNTSKFIMSHNPLPSVYNPDTSLGGASIGDTALGDTNEGEWNDYDYTSADNGEFSNRGYSSNSRNRPYTQQSNRSTEEEEE
jgi:hypothetical protein